MDKKERALVCEGERQRSKWRKNEQDCVSTNPQKVLWNSFIQQIFIEHILCSRRGSWHLGFINKLSKESLSTSAFVYSNKLILLKNHHVISLFESLQQNFIVYLINSKPLSLSFNVFY